MEFRTAENPGRLFMHNVFNLRGPKQFNMFRGVVNSFNLDRLKPQELFFNDIDLHNKQEHK